MDPGLAHSPAARPSPLGYYSPPQAFVSLNPRTTLLARPAQHPGSFRPVTLLLVPTAVL